MYNTDLVNLDRFHEDVLGGGSPRDAVPDYFPPAGMEMLECEENERGEWVPKKGLADKVEAR